MSAVEMALDKVRQLDESHALQLLNWLREMPCTAVPPRQPLGAMAMLGFARRFRPQFRNTAEWMTELRAGERE